MGVSCTKSLDVILDREVMLEIVDSITAFEEKLKRGEPLTKAQRTELRQVARITKEMKALQRFYAQ